MKFTDKEIKKWSQLYDELKYPTEIYNELVLKNKNCENKLQLMGAWKTGCLRINKDTSNSLYTDRKSNKYEYTGRWKSETPVGYDVWLELSNKLADIKNQVPKDRQKEKKPEILEELEEKKGFGYIWGLFVLHCIYPKIYPLYDQHVYRAYKYITTGKVNPKVAPNTWLEFNNYADFFNKITNESKFDISIVDRALWSYGKHLKILYSISIAKKNQLSKSSTYQS